MSRYYFDLFDGRLHKDEMGQDINDVSQVCVEIRRTLSDLVLHGNGPLSAIVSVRGAANQTVLTASISLAFDHPDTHH